LIFLSSVLTIQEARRDPRRAKNYYRSAVLAADDAPPGQVDALLTQALLAMARLCQVEGSWSETKTLLDRVATIGQVQMRNGVTSGDAGAVERARLMCGEAYAQSAAIAAATADPQACVRLYQNAIAEFATVHEADDVGAAPDRYFAVLEEYIACVGEFARSDPEEFGPLLGAVRKMTDKASRDTVGWG
jgi:hypothetical protein